MGGEIIMNVQGSTVYIHCIRKIYMFSLYMKSLISQLY